MFRSRTGFSISARFARHLPSSNALYSYTEQKGSEGAASGGSKTTTSCQPLVPARSPFAALRLNLARGALSALLLTSSVTASFAASDFFGVTSHFVSVDRFYPGQGNYWRVDNIAPILQELGVNTVHESIYALEASPRTLIVGTSKDAATLDRVNKNRQQFDDWMAYYDKAGIKIVLATLGISPAGDPNASIKNKQFSEWVAQLVAKHKSIVAVQLHNEPNLRQFWGRSTAKDYVDVYRPIAAAIKASRPDIKVLVGAISSLSWQPGVDWLKQAAQYGMFQFADGVAVHPYSVDMPPEVDPHWKGAPQTDMDHRQKALFAFEKMVTDLNGGKPLDLYFTEFGWNTATTGVGHVSEATQADYLGRMLLIYLDTRLKGVPIHSVYWYDLKDDGQDPAKISHRWGLVSYDLTKRKPAFFAMKSIISAFQNVDDFAIAKTTVDVTGAPSIKTQTWRRISDGATVFPYWSVARTEAKPAATVNLLFRGLQTKSATLHFADDRPPVAVDFKQTDTGTALSVPVSTRAAWLELKP